MFAYARVIALFVSLLLVTCNAMSSNDHTIAHKRGKQSLMKGLSLKPNAISIQANAIKNRREAIINDFKDEMVDIWDSLVYAETNKERVQTLGEIINRHQSTIGFISTSVMAVTVLRYVTKKRGKDLGMDYIKTMRRQEMEKWGRR
mmetsp:Transcript_38104/g.38788  ORF Transcript_38104/g.38788 Transcript_38104/m.38788 type:complete len:146 (+) Transcript_38104:184-621(+)